MHGLDAMRPGAWATCGAAVDDSMFNVQCSMFNAQWMDGGDDKENIHDSPAKTRELELELEDSSDLTSIMDITVPAGSRNGQEPWKGGIDVCSKQNKTAVRMHFCPSH
jgi:hypothetical protein